FAVGIRMLGRPAAVVVVMGRAAGMHMRRATVIADIGDAMLLGQAVEGKRAIDKGERSGGTQNTERIEQAQRERRPDAIFLGQPPYPRAVRHPPGVPCPTPANSAAVSGIKPRRVRISQSEAILTRIVGEGHRSFGKGVNRIGATCGSVRPGGKW